MSIHISASLLEDFVSCNKKVYYRLNRPELSIQNREMAIGNIVHKALELHWANKDKAFDFVNKQLAMVIPNDYSAIKFTHDCMDTFFNKFYAYITPDDEVEKRFKIPLGSDVFVVGKMDRISRQSVFDWKTARSPSKNISGNIQFILYNWAYRKIFNSSPAGVYYAALVTGDIVMYQRDEIAEKVLFSDLIPDAISAIRNKNFSANGVFRKSCFRCQYSESCLKEIREDELDRSTFTKK